MRVLDTTIKDPITKYTKIFVRKDGTEIKVVASAFFGAGLQLSVGTYVHRRSGPDKPWVLCSDQRHPDWKTMSRENYLKHGRSEVQKILSPGELLSVRQWIGKPSSELEATEA